MFANLRSWQDRQHTPSGCGPPSLPVWQDWSNHLKVTAQCGTSHQDSFHLGHINAHRCSWWTLSVSADPCTKTSSSSSTPSSIGFILAEARCCGEATAVKKHKGQTVECTWCPAPGRSIHVGIQGSFLARWGNAAPLHVVIKWFTEQLSQEWDSQAKDQILLHVLGEYEPHERAELPGRCSKVCVWIHIPC